MSVTLPARVELAPLWIRIVVVLTVWISARWLPSIYTMWYGTLARPDVMVAVNAGPDDSNPSH